MKQDKPLGKEIGKENKTITKEEYEEAKRRIREKLGIINTKREIILNLWYVTDEEGIIYSLRAKAYVGEGTDEEKMAFLKQRSVLDYLIAKPFEIPKQFHITVGSKVMPVAHVSMLSALSSPIAFFEEAIKDLEYWIPAQTKESIPQNPIVCTTALMQNKHGVIEPRIDVEVKYK